MSRTNRIAGLFILLTILPWNMASASTQEEKRVLSLNDRIGGVESVLRFYHQQQEGNPEKFEESWPAARILDRIQTIDLFEQALEDRYGIVITGEMLQREMERIDASTLLPTRLQNLYADLDHDPILIQEVLIRPALVEWLIQNRFNEDLPALVDLLATEYPSGIIRTAATEDSRLAIPEYGIENLAEASDLFTGGPFKGIRFNAASVWTGTHLILWGGTANDGTVFTRGSRYDPMIDRWSKVSASGQPQPRNYPSAVWTGTEMVVWGGGGNLVSGGRYSPSTDSWTAMSEINAPIGRDKPEAVWTGSEALFFGKQKFDLTCAPPYGGRYDPATDTWQEMARFYSSCSSYFSTIWTGTEVIVYGGLYYDGICCYFSSTSGYRYDPHTNIWTAISSFGGRSSHVAAWTGSEMFLQGGVEYLMDDRTEHQDGALYDPSTDSWTAISEIGAPAYDAGPAAVRFGDEIIVCCDSNGNGARYNFVQDFWTPMSNHPAASNDSYWAWTGDRLLVTDGTQVVLYDPIEDSWSVR